MSFLSRLMLAISRCRIGSHAENHSQIEVLEDRQLLSGVTVITHGYEAFSSNRPVWLNTMANAIVAQAGTSTAVYALRIVSGPAIQYFARLTPDPAPNGVGANGDAVILLDWADASGVVFSYCNTATIAQMVLPYLLQPIPALGITHPFAENPIHLIGHSRGASLVSALAGDLDANGVWVDQLTTLDPHPVSPDPTAVVYDNVMFADNYYETYNPVITELGVSGTSVTGADNVNLTSIVLGHGLIHTYYYGTIDTAATSDGDSETISNTWYASASTGPRNSVGFDWTLIGGGTRPSAGLSYYFGGPVNDGRVAVSLTATAWPNIAALSTGGQTSFAEGQSIPVSFMYSNCANLANVQFYLDTDQNPYNVAVSPTPFTVPSLHSNPTPGNAYATTTNVQPGTYYLGAVIKDNNFERFAYLPGQITVLPPAAPDGVAATYGTDSNEVRITWTASAGATGYDVYRDSISGNGNTATQINVMDISGLSFDDTTAAAGTVYWYWVWAHDGNGLGTSSTAVKGQRLAPTGSITATVFNDANGDGIRQSAEKPLANITVYIDANNNGRLDPGERTARTSKTGVYLFSNAPIDSYVVRPVLPAGYRPTTNLNTPLPTLLPGQAVGRNIGLSTNALVSGTVFLDTNKNSKLDATETGLAKYRVFVDKDKDGVWDANETSILTNGAGGFTFSTLAAGSYILRVVPAKGYKVGTPATQIYSLALKAGQVVAMRNFAIVKG